MTQSSRRKARRIRDARRAQAEARIARRRQEIAAGTRKGPKVATRKDREALSYAGGGKKQRYKHSTKRYARLEARRAARLADLTKQLRAETAGSVAEVVSVEFLGSSFPTVGNGTVALADGRVLAWSFRFRYDRAFLEVGTPDAEYDGLVDECVLAASRDDVTNEPYNGYLDGRELIALLGELFSELAEPATGERFQERAANTIALATGEGGDPEAPTLIRYVTTP